MINCPACEIPVNVSDQSKLSEILECADCRSELEVVALDPVMLALAPEVEEDWGE
jgi:alpha-aminoadipate/glutamate carrier protein LysW